MPHVTPVSFFCKTYQWSKFGSLNYLVETVGDLLRVHFSELNMKMGTSFYLFWDLLRLHLCPVFFSGHDFQRNEKRSGWVASDD